MNPGCVCPRQMPCPIKSPGPSILPHRVFPISGTCYENFTNGFKMATNQNGPHDIATFDADRNPFGPHDFTDKLY